MILYIYFRIFSSIKKKYHGNFGRNGLNLSVSGNRER